MHCLGGVSMPLATSLAQPRVTARPITDPLRLSMFFFTVASISSGEDDAAGAPPPLCKHKATRSEAMELLVALARLHPAVMAHLLRYVSGQHHLPQPTEGGYADMSSLLWNRTCTASVPYPSWQSCA